MKSLDDKKHIWYQLSKLKNNFNINHLVLCYVHLGWKIYLYFWDNIVQYSEKFLHHSTLLIDIYETLKLKEWPFYYFLLFARLLYHSRTDKYFYIKCFICFSPDSFLFFSFLRQLCIKKKKEINSLFSFFIHVRLLLARIKSLSIIIFMIPTLTFAPVEKIWEERWNEKNVMTWSAEKARRLILIEFERFYENPLIPPPSETFKLNKKHMKRLLN